MDISTTDGGIYTCNATINGSNKIVTDMTTLCVEVSIIATNVISDIVVGNNNTVIRCVDNSQSLDNVTITWTHSTTDGTISNDNSLSLPTIIPSLNNTHYTCNVRVTTNPMSCMNQIRKVTIIVRDTYIESVSVSNVSPTINTLSVMECTITINTPIGPDLSVINYYWYHNETMLDHSIYNITHEYTNGSTTFITRLTIPSVNTTHGGIYKCSGGILEEELLNSTADLCVEVPFTFNETYDNLRLGDIIHYNCISSDEPGVSVEWMTPTDVTLNDSLILTVNQSINNTNYTCVISIDGNPSNCIQQRKDVHLLVRDTYVTSVSTSTIPNTINGNTFTMTIGTPQCIITTNTDINTTNISSVLRVVWYFNGSFNVIPHLLFLAAPLNGNH
jgi:hypothetical protein